MKRPKVLFAYRHGVLGGVATQLLNRYAEFNLRFDVRMLFEKDDGVTGRFPPGVAHAIGDPAERVGYMTDLAPDLTVIIDSPSMLQNWHSAGRRGTAVLEVHTTTANIGYLDQMDAGAGISGIVTVSDYMRGFVESTGIGSAVPVRVVSNCLGSEWFVRAAINGLQPAPGVPVIWVGKLDGHKRILTALDVLERIVVELDGEVRVVPVLIGGYASGSDRVRHVLQSAANRPALRDRLEWIPRVDYRLMPSVLRAAGRAGGISLSATKNESFGMSIAESLAAGCRVVAPRVGALPEIVPEVMLYPDQDYQAAHSMAAAMLRNRQLHAGELEAVSVRLESRMAPSSTLAQFDAALDDFGFAL